MTDHCCAHSSDFTADPLTKFTAAVNFVSDSVSNTFLYIPLLAPLFLLAGPMIFSGITLPAIFLGLGITLLVTASSTYCQSVVNTLSQREESFPDQKATPCDSDLPVEKQDDLKVNKKLTIKQRVALFGDFISQTGNQIVPFMFVITLSGITLPFSLALQIGAVSLGVLAAVAPVRRDMNALKRLNGGIDNDSQDNGQIHTADRWTKITAGVDLTTGTINNTLLYTAFLTYLPFLIAGPTILLGANLPILSIGLALGFLTALGAAYCHKVLNTHNQTEQIKASAEERKAISLGKKQYLALVADFLSHTGEVSTPFIFVIALITPVLPFPVILALQITAVAVGMIASIAPVRSCHASLVQEAVEKKRAEKGKESQDAATSPTKPLTDGPAPDYMDAMGRQIAVTFSP